jgi:hypothetical protein
MSERHKHRPAGSGAPPLLLVKVQRLAKPPMPWTWAIHKEGAAEAHRRSIRFYRSAEEAWAAGRAVADRMGKPL